MACPNPKEIPNPRDPGLATAVPVAVALLLLTWPLPKPKPLPKPFLNGRDASCYKLYYVVKEFEKMQIPPNPLWYCGLATVISTKTNTTNSNTVWN